MPFMYAYQITLEKTPEYFTSVNAPKRIHSFNSKMKLILIIRDPVIRAVSQFAHYCAKRKIKIDKEGDEKLSELFKSLIFDKKENLKNNSNQIVKPGRYIESYKNWLKYFPKEQILVLVG